jgi:DsbC/DsbD-like thiol-disulfide interchange protein
MLPDWAPIANDAHSQIHACFVPRFEPKLGKICVFFMYVFMYVPPTRSDHARVHDEFSGTRKVSAVDRATMTGLNRLRRSAALLGICAMSLIAASDASADDASPWDGDARSAVRLVAGSSPAPEQAAIRAGIAIRLKNGWHTYWRYPGDAGVPPRFDFAGSENAKSVEVRWPAPQRISEQGLVAIGYAGDVILPLIIVPQNREKPVKLRLKVDYAVCETLCVPAEGQSELVLTGGPSSHDAALAAAEARVPKKAALGEASPFAVKSVRREQAGPRPRVVVEVAAPSATQVDLFAEGPTPDWALPVPVAVAGAPAGLQRFAFELDGAPPGATYDGAHITLTAVAEDNAIEVTVRLD